jgi:hypothetical protein
MPSAAASAVLAKWDTSTGDREWQFLINSAGDINLVIFDETNNAMIGRYVDTPLTLGQWVFIVGRYDGGTDAANIDIFRNGVEAHDRNHSDAAAFASKVDGDTAVTLAHPPRRGWAESPVRR